MANTLLPLCPVKYGKSSRSGGLIMRPDGRGVATSNFFREVHEFFTLK